MLNKDGLNKKKTEEPKQDTVKEPVTSSENVSIRERIEEYSNTRMTSGRINETHQRATFLVDQDTLTKLNNLVDLMEGTNGLDSKYQDNKTVKQVRDDRLFSKGFKSKLINFSLDTILEEWEQSQGLIPEVSKIRYKAQDGTYHRTFKFKEEGILYLITQSNRGHEIEFLTSEVVSESEIESKFTHYVELAESQSNK